jgi:putative transposase
VDLFVMPRFWRPAPVNPSDDELVHRAREVLTSSIGAFLDPDRLQALAEDEGCVERRSKHHAGLMAVALILSALRHGPDTEGRWLDAQTLYERLGGRHAGTTGFRDRIRALEPMFRELLHRRVLALQEGRPALEGRLSAFADVLIPDGCAFKVASALAGVWPGTGTPAEFKLHAVYSVRAGGLAELQASAGSVHDNKGFGPGSWVPHALYIWDLGYQDYDRFVDAVLSKAVPLQRLKDDANPVVLAWYDADGVRRPLRDEEGGPMRLQEASGFGHLPLHGALDLDVQIVHSDGRKVTARVVCVPHGEDRWYLTALPREVFTPFDVAELYRVRWEVELFFRDLKGAVRLDEVARLKNPASLRMAVLASLVAATLGQQLTAALNAQELPPPCTDTHGPPRSPARDAAQPSARSHPASAEAGFSPLLRVGHGARQAHRARTG